MMSRHAFKDPDIDFGREKKRLGRDLIPMSRQDNEQTNNLSHSKKMGVVTKNQWLTTEMVSRHAF